MKSFQSEEVFHYAPIKVDLMSSGSWILILDIKFSKLLWGFVILSLLVLFTLFFL